jgi:hypothetical protein
VKNHRVLYSRADDSRLEKKRENGIMRITKEQGARENYNKYKEEEKKKKKKKEEQKSRRKLKKEE